MTMVLKVEGRSESEKDMGFQKQQSGGFPGGPVVKIPCSQCRAPVSNLWSGNEIPQACLLQVRLRWGREGGGR